MINDWRIRFTKLSQLKKNVASGAVLSGFDSLAGLVAYPLYLKYLGAEKYGLWATVSVVLAFCRLGQFGIDTAITKYVAGEYGKKNLKAITEYISTSFYILLIPSVIILGILGFFNPHIAKLMMAEGTPIDNVGHLIFCMGFLSVLSLFVNVMRGVVTGIGRMDIANYVSVSSRLSQVGLALVLLLSGYGIWSLYFGFLLSYVLSLTIWAILLKRNYRIRIFNPVALRRNKLVELLKYGGGLTAALMANMLVMPFNKVVIARYVGLSQVAYYQVVTRVITSLRGVFVEGLHALLPRISEIKGKFNGTLESSEKIASIHRKGMRFLLLFACPLFALTFAFAHPLFKIWLGSGFDAQIAVVARILLVGWLANMLGSPDYFTFLGIGKVRYIVAATWIKSAVNVILIVVLLSIGTKLTLNTVVVVTCASLLISAIFLKYKYFKHIRRTWPAELPHVSHRQIGNKI